MTYKLSFVQNLHVTFSRDGGCVVFGGGWDPAVGGGIGGGAMGTTLCGSWSETVELVDVVDV